MDRVSYDGRRRNLNVPNDATKEDFLLNRAELCYNFHISSASWRRAAGAQWKIRQIFCDNNGVIYQTEITPCATTDKLRVFEVIISVNSLKFFSATQKKSNFSCCSYRWWIDWSSLFINLLWAFSDQCSMRRVGLSTLQLSRHIPTAARARSVSRISPGNVSRIILGRGVTQHWPRAREMESISFKWFNFVWFFNSTWIVHF